MIEILSRYYRNVMCQSEEPLPMGRGSSDSLHDYSSDVGTK